MTISAFSSETSSADGGRFTTTYTARRAREAREAEAGVSEGDATGRRGRVKAT